MEGIVFIILQIFFAECTVLKIADRDSTDRGQRVSYKKQPRANIPKHGWSQIVPSPLFFGQIVDVDRLVRRAAILVFNASETGKSIQNARALVVGLRWPNTVLARGFADANQHVHKDLKKQTCRQQSDHFIYSTPALSVLFFSIIACSLLMALVFYYNDMLQKVTMQRTQHYQLLFVTERTQLNATHAQLLEKLRPIALAETFRFLAIQSLEFQEIWQKNRSETT